MKRWHNRRRPSEEQGTKTWPLGNRAADKPTTMRMRARVGENPDGQMEGPTFFGEREKDERYGASGRAEQLIMQGTTTPTMQNNS